MIQYLPPPTLTPRQIWGALAAGCVPIYMGSSNIRDMLPEPGAAIVYGPGGDVQTPAELDALMHRVGSDKALFEGYMAWKKKPVCGPGAAGKGILTECPLLQHNTVPLLQLGSDMPTVTMPCPCPCHSSMS